MRIIDNFLYNDKYLTFLYSVPSFIFKIHFFVPTKICSKFNKLQNLSFCYRSYTNLLKKYLSFSSCVDKGAQI